MSDPRAMSKERLDRTVRQMLRATAERDASVEALQLANIDLRKRVMVLELAIKDLMA